MNALVLASLLLLVMMTYRLVDTYAGGHYVCPSCGSRGSDRHSADCPWSGDR